MSLYVHQKRCMYRQLKDRYNIHWQKLFEHTVLFDQDFLWHMCLICKTFAGRIYRRGSLQQMWKKKWYSCMQKGKLNSLNMDGFKCAIKIICFPTIGFRWEEFFLEQRYQVCASSPWESLQSWYIEQSLVCGKWKCQTNNSSVILSHF